MRRPHASALALVALAATVSLSAGCGSSSSSATGDAPPTSASPAASATALTSSASPTTDAVTSFCDHIAPGGKGPADAFMEILLTDPSTARSTALAEQRLMQGALPPAAIAQDWKTWQTYVAAVVRASRDGGSLASVAGLEQNSRGAQKRLTAYAFAHCS